MEKIIIGIHGIGNKPPAKILRQWWLESIYEGLKKNNYSTSGFNFELVYWADILHKLPLDPEDNDRKKTGYMQEKYIAEGMPVINYSTGFRQKAIDYLEKYYDKLIINRVLTSASETITELFIHLHMKDLESYYSSTYIENNGSRQLVREAIIERLISVLRKHKNKKIMLVAHSLGTVIIYDALNKKIPDLEIDTLVTIGSPLGQKFVLDNYKKQKTNGSVNKLRVPDNIKKHWYNLADLEDQVALKHRLSGLYEKNSNNLEVTDILVKNNYSYHGKQNPHKSFGYLRTPEFAEIINAFVTTKQAGVFGWLKEKLGKLLSSI